MPIDPRLISIVEKQSYSKTIAIVLGELYPLSEEQLRSQWSQLVQNTPLARSSLAIRIVPAQQQCMVCFEKYHPVNKETACPVCMSAGAKILTGEELYVEPYSD